MPARLSRGRENSDETCSDLRPGRPFSALPLQTPEQPGAGRLPVAHRGRHRCTEHAADLLEREAAEEAELGDTSFAGGECGQLVEGVVVGQLDQWLRLPVVVRRLAHAADALADTPQGAQVALAREGLARLKTER